MKIDTSKLSERTINLLIEAGWDKNRDVSSQVKYPKNDFEYPNFLREILNNIYGLEIDSVMTDFVEDGQIRRINTGITIIDPMLAEGENEENSLFNYYSNKLKTNLYPLGETGEGYFYLAIDSNAALYMLGSPVFKMDDDFNKGLEKLLTGQKGKKLNDICIPYCNLP